VTERDALAKHNERMTALAGFVNALGLRLIGFAVLRPLTDNLTDTDSLTNAAWTTLGWGIAGLAMHGLSHYILKRPAVSLRHTRQP